MSWWQRARDRLFSRTPAGSVEPAQAAKPAPASPSWLAAEDPENPFGAPLLSLMGNLQLSSFTKDPAVAARAISWRPGHHERLRWTVQGESVDCGLIYRVEEALPDGMLFIPKAMEDKWVIAWMRGQLALARSWSGETEVLADAQIVDGCLRVTRLTFAASGTLSAFGDPVAAFHWIMLSHVLEQRVPFPASGQGAEILKATPLVAMSLYGHRLFCAAVDYTLPTGLSSQPVRSDGELVAALGAADLPQITALLEQGHSLTAPARHNGYRPVHLAVCTKNAGVVRLLLSRGADPNQTADHELRPLPLAIVLGCEETMLHMLVEAGADLESEDEKKFRPVHAACEVGNLMALGFLHARGADIEARTKDGFTPLHIACALGELAAAKELVRLGASTRAISSLGTPLDVARKEGKDDVAAWLEGTSPVGP